jgi:2-polyprenyl-3-methyl-5-hydroxy-6-metoxy-1,4-benzoquinol methylase
MDGPEVSPTDTETQGAPLNAKTFGGRTPMTGEESSWERFSDAHAPVYMDNVFTKYTLREVDFLLEELALQPGSSILDVGCGTGRHSIELSKRGYAVTGLDLSAETLVQA